MTTFAKKTMSLSEWTQVMDMVGTLQQTMGAPHDLMMLSCKSSDRALDDIYIGLPDAKLLAVFPGFVEVSRKSLPDYMSTLVVREDGFAERFPDIADKRRTRFA